MIEMAGAEDDANGQAWARLEAARALIALGREPARARKLLVEARKLYSTAKLPKRVAEVDRLATKVR